MMESVQKPKPCGTEVVHERARFPGVVASSRESRTCWICFEGEGENSAKKWTKPCRCKGTMKWVHNDCLLRWIDKKQEDDPAEEVACPACRTTYVVISGKRGRILSCVENLKKMVFRCCPYLLSLFVMCTLYCLSLVYGHSTVTLICGIEKSVEMFEETNPMWLPFALPLIPVMLIGFRLLRWEDYVLHLWLRYSRLSGVNYSVPHTYARIPIRDLSLLAIFPDFIMLMSEALFLPSIGVATGNILFSSLQSRLKRALLGCVAYTALKGTIQIYYKRQLFVQQSDRTVRNFDDLS